MDKHRLLPCGAISAAVGIAFAHSSSFLFFAVFISVPAAVSMVRKQYLLFLFCAVCCGFYSIYFLVIDHLNGSIYQEGAIQTSASVGNVPTIDGDRLSFKAETPDGESLKARYTIQSQEEKRKLADLGPGSICFMKGELKKPKNATVPGTFNEKEYLRTQGIHWNFAIQSIKNCKQKDALSSILLNIRKSGLDFIEDNMSETAAGVVCALIFGDRFLIEQEVLDGYQSLGIIHLLAISGLHVGILAAALFYCLLRLGITREGAKWILIFALPAAAVITGGAPSVLRAVFMSDIYLLSSLSKKRLKSADVLSIAFLGLLLYNPYLLFQAGFQLSFAVSFVFILSKGILLRPKNKTAQLLLASFLAQLGSLPILLFHFQEFSFLSVLANLFFVPFYLFAVIPLSFASLLGLMLIRPAGEIAAGILDILLGWSHEAVKIISSADMFTFAASKPDGLQLLFYLGSIGMLLIAMENAVSLRKLFIPSCLFISVFLWHVMLPHFTQDGEVTMLDIGQGDSIYISGPRQKGNVLIDTGGMVSFKKEPWRERKKAFSLAENVIIPFLATKGVQQLDALILTHADQDHVGEAEVLIKKHKVKELVVPIGYAADPADEKLLRTAIEHGVAVKAAKRGDKLNIGGLQFYVLSPEKVDGDSKNNSSLVLWMKLGGLTWLLTGDLEQDGEREIMKAYPELKADVLKVGHHGSKGSTGENFIKQIKPKTALISAGEHNRYGHPHKEVLDILKRHRVKVYRTDRDGAVQYLFDRGKGTFLLHPPYDKVHSTQ
ncbi:DNA internalization-related competence protein ComEC/Rec2 [Bacillus sonorensis]|uniref:DNA internalization-related competence protein ComEC/Rec2 n=1 Tax=Bacillus sonorensis TaxID=119858 RepID=UPI00098B1DA3|nr:DNA internalization-related competence protein ComEC/Rec2 [Bacillus sonorensis]